MKVSLVDKKKEGKFKLFCKKLANFVDKVFYPSNIKCLCCQIDLPEKQDIEFCKTCFKNFVFIHENCCSVCGVKISGNGLCLNCKSHKRDFDKARSVFSYEGEIQKLIINFKYNNKPYISKTFGKLLAEKFEALKWQADGVLFVPMTKKRFKKRGYNQAELLCREFSKETKIPVFENVLIKTKETKRQAKLGFKARQENIKKSFQVLDKDIIKGKTILLVDDVFTTGATSNACSQKLKVAGAKAVFVLTVASTPSKILTFKPEKAKKDK